MPYPATHKQNTRARILDSAADLFAGRGYDNVSIDDVMRHAGLTRGAFYAHFASKGELYAEALLSAAAKTTLAATQPQPGAEREWIAGLIRGYLSGEHVSGTSVRCPMAFLVTDVAVREAPVRQTYTAVFQRMRERIARAASAYSDCGEDEVLAATAMMIGAVAIGRALDDPAAVDELLDSCHATARRLLACD
ncbi:MAG TPA: TetR/AcrR family transcriptional regulator [Gammaproteobacteria bacterium]|nr:TetR/AcrR family transcriptional regulator [Gammaproteobacteria bacterium]